MLQGFGLNQKYLRHSEVYFLAHFWRLRYVWTKINICMYEMYKLYKICTYLAEFNFLNSSIQIQFYFL